MNDMTGLIAFYGTENLVSTRQFYGEWPHEGTGTTTVQRFLQRNDA